MNNTLNTFLAEIVFAKPYFLWLLLALPLLWFRFRDRRLVVLLARSLILALVILTLADPQSASEESRDQERIFAYDVSDSIPTSMRDWMKSSARPVPAPSRHDRVFVFGAAAAGVSNWREVLDGDRAKNAGAAPEKTSLENLFNALLALPAGPRSLYLFTDGWENQGNV